MVISFSKTKPFTFPSQVRSDINLYGDEAPVFEWDVSSTSDIAYLSKVNHVKADGTLYIPRHYENKEIYIGSYVFTDSRILTVYIPNTIGRIEGSGNYQNKDMAIYYEGSEEEWNNIFKNSKSKPSNITFMNGVGFPY